MANRADNSRLLLYLDRRALAVYRSEPAKYVLREDDMGGEVLGKDPAANHVHVGFGHRRLEDGTVCLAVFAPDVVRLPSKERQLWLAHRLADPRFLQNDEPFERWCSRNLNGSWEAEDGPIVRIPAAISRINALTEHALGTALWRSEEHELLNYPVAEDPESYSQAHLELYRLLIDGLRKESLLAISKHAGVTLTCESKTLNSLKELLPPQLVDTVHTPLKTCAELRNKKHGVPSSITASPAFDTFHGDLVKVENALGELQGWLESVFGVRAETCLESKQAMETFFGHVVGPPRPEGKLADLQLAVGKTIEKVVFGEEEARPDIHRAEAIEIHFTDGFAVSIRVNSNAEDLASGFDGLHPGDFSTWLDVFWAPAIGSVEPTQ